jgi:hypothetical protein
LLTQLKRLQAAWRAAAPHTQLIVLGNYMSPPATNLKALYDNMLVTVTGGGGPDLAPPRAVDGYSVVQGTIGGYDFRDKIAQSYNYEYLPYLNGQTAQQAYDFGVSTLHANYIAWRLATNGTSDQNWDPGIIAVINAHPATVTTCPTSYSTNGSGGCDTSH